MSDVNYKIKYQELKLKFMNSVDLAFRLGYEQGLNDAQLQAAQDQAAQAQLGAEQSNEQGQPGDEGQEPNEQQASAHPDGTELDQHIAELESMLGKSEINSSELQKVVNDLKQAQELKKSAQAIKGISKALHTSKFKLNAAAQQNLSSSAKKSLSSQEEIVNGIFKAWNDEESKAKKDINTILSVEGILKKD